MAGVHGPKGGLDLVGDGHLVVLNVCVDDSHGSCILTRVQDRFPERQSLLILGNGARLSSRDSVLSCVGIVTPAGIRPEQCLGGHRGPSPTVENHTKL